MHAYALAYTCMHAHMHPDTLIGLHACIVIYGHCNLWTEVTEIVKFYRVHIFCIKQLQQNLF